MEDGSTLSLLTPYPINSIYMAETETSPASIFGGEWERIEKKFLLGHGTGNTLGQVGGEETHTLTIAEMPSHTHSYYDTAGSYTYCSNYNDKLVTLPSWAEQTRNTYSSGGGGSHNNMPPYYVVNIWKRVA